ncbi:unnamed protein product [Cylindrotheca closterium]|uniref:FAD-binding FR-type domain-containing protein n=1 Tax=Cylindrotheca closterium TaxID=2856 RepID=A0AAD2G678_9STRA|nr:unnamed protein product [Cylindrotheca closterium]
MDSCFKSMNSDGNKELFQKARILLNPSAFLRSATYLYAERKLLVFFLVHFVCTLVIWAHFALRKLDAQLANVPEAANRYWWKIVAPPLEFGSMHAILFQMALLPLTMARFSIASLCDSSLNSILPLNRTLRMHIHLGYTMIFIVFWAVIFFFTFFGLLCSDGEEAFCEKFTEEIMITGYCILAFLLLVGFTSYFRHSIPYQIFYAVHHAVFVMYFVTIAHTLDVKAREGGERSQTFKWFSASVLFYFCDRAAMYLNHRYYAEMTSSAVVEGTNGSRMIILKLKRPTLFQFKAGQSALLRIKGIEMHWHPFSIASGPESDELEFYIEVYGASSWTSQLWDLLIDEEGIHDPHARLFVEVKGPYGTSLASTDDYTHVLSLGSGTGIVPVLSLYKEHIRNMLALDPIAYLEELDYREQRIHQVQLQMERRKGSIAKKVITMCHSPADEDEEQEDGISRKSVLRVGIQNKLAKHNQLTSMRDIRKNMSELKKGASEATRFIYGTVVLCIAPVLGVVVLGLTISWNTTKVDLTPKMYLALEILTVLFQCIFATVSLFVWDSTSMVNYLDLVISLIAPFADWYWYRVYEEQRSKLSPEEVILASVFLGYMVVRLWTRAVHPFHQSWKKHIRNHGSGSSVNCLELVWTTRSASQASKILPDIASHYNALVKAWGAENAKEVCRVKICVTDADPVACAQLQEEMKTTASGIELSIGRLDIGRWIEDHTLRMIDAHKRSYSLLAFCGSPRLAQEIHQQKISNDMIKAVTGYKNHQMDFVSESYGGASKGKEPMAQGAEKESKPSKSLNRFSSISYERGNSGVASPFSGHMGSGEGFHVSPKFTPLNRPSLFPVNVNDNGDE